MQNFLELRQGKTKWGYCLQGSCCLQGEQNESKTSLLSLLIGNLQILLLIIIPGPLLAIRNAASPRPQFSSYQLMIAFFHLPIIEVFQIHNQRIMRIDYSKPPKTALYALPPQNSDPQDPFPVGDNPSSEEIQIQIDFQFEDYGQGELDYLDGELTEEEELLLDFLLPDRPRSSVVSSSGRPYSQFIAASISQYELKQIQNQKRYSPAPPTPPHL